MSAEAKRQPTALELRIASDVIVLTDPSPPENVHVLLHCARTELARALNLTPEESERISRLDASVFDAIVADLRGAYDHMASFNQLPDGGVSIQLRARLAALKDVLA